VSSCANPSIPYRGRTQRQTPGASVEAAARERRIHVGHQLAAAEKIKLFSFAGDVVLDPFAGTGSTAIAALSAGRSSISVEIEPSYLTLALRNIEQVTRQRRLVGAGRLS
jgi:predicted methyltransferase